MTERKANPDRGEVEIILDGQAYPLRPSREAIKMIELGTGKSLQALIVAAGTKSVGLTLDQRETIVLEGIKAAGRDRSDSMLISVNRDKVGELLYASGWMAFEDQLVAFLINAASGGADGAKKAPAAAAIQ